MISRKTHKPFFTATLLGPLVLTAGLALITGCDTGSSTRGASALSAPNTELTLIAHRGASGYLPEHTLEGYELAVELGADYIEPDLQFTSDGELVAMHDSTLDRTTNVKVLFPDAADYNVSSFTLAQIKTLTVQPVNNESTTYAGFTSKYGENFTVPTFQEVITLSQKMSLEKGRYIGLYPEAKQGDEEMGRMIVDTLKSNGLTGAEDYVYIQSFSNTILKYIKTYQESLGMSIPLIVLGYALPSSDGSGTVLGVGQEMEEYSKTAEYADGIGFYKDGLTYGSMTILEVDKDIVDEVHSEGLLVHIWTFSQSDETLAAEEYGKFFETGIDGFFTNYTDLALTARDKFLAVK